MKPDTFELDKAHTWKAPRAFLWTQEMPPVRLYVIRSYADFCEQSWQRSSSGLGCSLDEWIRKTAQTYGEAVRGVSLRHGSPQELVEDLIEAGWVKESEVPHEPK